MRVGLAMVFLGLVASSGAAAKTVIPLQRIEIKARIQFAVNQVRIPQKSRPLLDRIGQALRDHPSLTRIEVAGHCEPREARYSRRPGWKRAKAVARYLTRKWKISARRLVVKDYGPTRPIASNRTARGRAQNRRVDFRVLRVTR